LNLTSTNLETPPGPPAVQQEPLPPVWLQRLFAAVYVLFCMMLGMVLLTTPWRSDWFETGWILQYPTAQAILQHGFVRGAISGLGLVDIFFGVMEAVSYHDRR
jgi:hypothetical protein